jgi:DNA ligase-1
MNHDSTLPILYSRTSKGAINTWRVWTEGGTVCTEWGQVGGKLQQSTFECSPKNVGRSNATTAEEQAILEAESLHSKQKRKKYSETLEQAETDTEIRPMLAQDFSKHKSKVKWPAFVQPKFDGLRAMAYKKDDQVVLHSRGNKFYTAPHIQESLNKILKPGMVLDGELYLHGTSLQTINSWVRGKKPEVSQIQYYVYDIVTEDTFIDRWSKLREVAFNFDDLSLVLSTTEIAQDEDHAIQIQAEYVAKGYEGAMVRTSTGKYRYGYRSPDLLKVKSWVTEEFPILGHKVGKGKFSDVPMIICGLSNGETFDVTPTGTMEQRKELLGNIQSHVGKMYTVKFFDYSPKGVPLYPSGVSVRFEEDLP